MVLKCAVEGDPPAELELIALPTEKHADPAPASGFCKYDQTAGILHSEPGAEQQVRQSLCLVVGPCNRRRAGLGHSGQLDDQCLNAAVAFDGQRKPSVRLGQLLRQRCA